MQTALVFGLTQRDITFLKPSLTEKRSPIDTSWRVVFFSSQNSKIGLRLKAIPQLLQEATKHENVHIFGFYTPTSAIERSDISRRIRNFFRFRWLDNSLITLVRSGRIDDFHAELEDVFVEEGFWEDRIKPQAISSPTLLPEISFNTTTFSEFWKHVEGYGDLESLRGVPRLIARFTAALLKQIDDEKAWLDEKDVVFSFRGAAHAVAPFPRCWKYSWHIPEGFHYDARHRHGRKFEVRGIDGQLRSVGSGSYINIDPHGDMRD